MPDKLTDNEIVMGEQMNFPKTFDKFAEQYKIIDEKEVYTNGTELIPIFRVKQWLENTDNLINRLQAENERLREIRDLCNTTILEKNEQIEKLEISDASKEECTIKQHGEIKELKAENKRLSTLAELGNTRANDYRVMRDRALKAEAENERLKAVAKKMHTWIFLNSCDEEKAYAECGLTYEENALLGYCGKIVFENKELVGEQK